ncbi:MAG TPA: ABC transporter permease [Candidatus Polarisedimenticolia bacterium]|jgi:putative ABC transport system permease protein|nr:ABC transporter permease [Candidatus Polarisedimenticolia bacterium]
MKLWEILRTVLGEIRHHKMRSMLTLLGIILGTLSITVMTSLLEGIITTVWAGFADIGYDGVVLVLNRGARDLRESAVFARSEGLRPRDAEIVLARRKLVTAVAPVTFWEEIVRNGSVQRKARISGVTPSYATVRNREVESGRFFNEVDENSFTRVCVLGYRLKNRLFGSEDPLGKTVKVGERVFTVVGVGKKLGNQFVNDDDFIEEMEGLYVPLGTLRKFYKGEAEPLDALAIKTGEVERLGDVKAEVQASLKIAHRGAEDFRVQNIAEELLRARQEVTEEIRSWTVVLSAIAGVSLVVGGIGLLSVMLISIGERLYEIGLRKAIGATDFEIFLQFLSESVILSSLGGLLGIGGGIAITKWAGSFFRSGLPIHLDGLAIALGTALVLGVLSGIYPALKASRLEPVEALRSSA